MARSWAQLTRRGKAPVDGGEVEYLIVGEGPPVAATHPYVNPKSGYGGDGYGGVPECSTVTVWPRGFGESSRPRNSGDHGLLRLADDLESVRRHLGFARWGFWGVSMGGFVGLLYALRYQPALSLLILDSTAPSYHYTLDSDSIWPALRSTAEQKAWASNPSPATLRPFFTKMWELMGAPNPGAMMDDWLRRMEFNSDALAEILAHIQEYDTRARLGEIRVPTLVLAGDKDFGVRPSQGKIIADGIPGATLSIFPAGGHGILNQRLSGVEALVQDLVRRRVGA